MTKATKKLISSLAILIIALALATTTTFAWFTLNATPEVGGFDLNVTSTDGLYISTTGEKGTFKSKLSTVEILTTILTGKATTEELTEAGVDSAKLQTLLKKYVVMDALTSTDGKAFTKQDDAVATANSYLSFEMHFRSLSNYTVALNDDKAGTADATLVGNTVTANSTATNKYVQAWKAIGANEYSTNAITALAIGDDIVARAANATRISFENATTATVWEPNKTAGFDQGNLALDYINYMNGSALEVPTAVGKAPVVTKDDKGMIGAQLLTLTEAAGVYTGTLTISIWLEGWDGDCFNSILTDSFNTALQFKGTLVV